MTREEQAKAFTQLHEHLQSLIGKQLQIAEFITDREYDRHGTSSIYFTLTVKEINWRFSGFRLRIEGNNEELYEISPSISELKIEADTIEVVETLGISTINTPLKRKTSIKII
ncbi:hypothetical protein Q0590_23040 [Rhodocytophaga aerolata]|uniref:Uncharacterized protein n=1 Tax=Rhodocytophaga aerolata TaxID=455078 RepID=A0ABT8RBV4_9BACT|nr:hypothetical protein [Rhodocytophaga aerolata]MDO1449171.1 hypothetical protein [Rhodocytophaga aerolata]